MYPFVPGYRLGGIAYETENEIGVWTWVRRARAMPGEIFLVPQQARNGRGLLTMTPDPLVEALFIIVAFVVAGLAHSAWLGSRWSSKLMIPLDGGMRDSRSPSVRRQQDGSRIRRDDSSGGGVIRAL